MFNADDMLQKTSKTLIFFCLFNGIPLILGYNEDEFISIDENNPKSISCFLLNAFNSKY